MNEKITAQTPKETEQAVSDLAAKLEEIDKAEGVFGESMRETLTDTYLDEIAGGMAHIIPTSPTICPVCKGTVDIQMKYYICPNGKDEKECPYVEKPKSNPTR